MLARLSAPVLYWATWLWAWCYFAILHRFVPLFSGYRIRGGDKTVSTAYLQSIILNHLQQDPKTTLDASQLPTVESATINRGEIRAGLTGDMFKISIQWNDKNNKNTSLPTSLVVKAKGGLLLLSTIQ
jgi:hypothetical protein